MGEISKGIISDIFLWLIPTAIGIFMMFIPSSLYYIFISWTVHGNEDEPSKPYIFLTRLTGFITAGISLVRIVLLIIEMCGGFK